MGFTRIPAERAACVRSTVHLDCPAGLMLGELGSKEPAAAVPAAKPARTPLGELTSKGADNSSKAAPAAAPRPATLDKVTLYHLDVAQCLPQFLELCRENLFC